MNDCNPWLEMKRRQESRWGTHKWKFDLRKDLKINKIQQREFYETIFAIDPVIVHLELTKRFKRLWQIQLAVKCGTLKLKQNIPMTFQFDLKCSIMRLNTGSSYPINGKFEYDASNCKLIKKVPQNACCQSWHAVGLSQPEKIRLLEPSYDDNQTIEVQFDIYIKSCSYNNQSQDAGQMRNILAPYMYTKDELKINDLIDDKSKLQKENDKLKQQLQKLKDQMGQLNIAQNSAVFDVNQFLNNVNLGIYGDILIDAGFDDKASILDLTDDDLKEIGIVKLGHRKKLLKAVADLN